MADKCGESNNKYRTYYRNTTIKYDNKDLLDAVELMLKGKSTAQNYQLDVVNFTRQLLGNYSLPVFAAYKAAYKKGDFQEMQVLERRMLNLMEDVDRLCATQRTFLMGKWIEEARAKGGTDSTEIKYYEQNARNLLTTWGEKAALLNDYASRQWNGLVGSFYAQRYKIFFAAVNKAMIEGKEFGEKEEKEAQKTITDFEEKWWKDCIGEFPSEPEGDGVAIARELVAKWKPFILKQADTKFRKNK
jgi:alpha-N-acetylglucosaminidase